MRPKIIKFKDYLKIMIVVKMKFLKEKNKYKLMNRNHKKNSKKKL